MKIQLIAEGSTKRQRALRRWGVAFLIGNVLFDAFGRADIFWKNIRQFRINLARVKQVVISHDDWDHTAGLESFLQDHPNARTYVCRKTGERLKELIRRSGSPLIEVDAPRKIGPNIFSLGQMRADTGRGILYEQALAVRSHNGFSVITGCAHPGIIRIVKHAIKLFGKPLYAVCGGFHMKDNNPSENEAIADALRALDVQKVIPLHCSGALACRVFDGLYKRNRIKLREGDAFEL